MKTNGLKVSLLFGVMVLFLDVYGLIPDVHGAVLVEDEDKMVLSLCVPSCRWSNRNKFVI